MAFAPCQPDAGGGFEILRPDPARCVPDDERSGLGQTLPFFTMKLPRFILLYALSGVVLVCAIFFYRLVPVPADAAPVIQVTPVQMGFSGHLWRSYAGLPVEMGLDIPEVIRLDSLGKRGAVIFPHQMHFRAVQLEGEARSCQVCHHTAEPREMPGTCSPCHEVQANQTAPKRERAFHRSCRDCHREVDAGPTKCSDCHVK